MTGGSSPRAGKSTLSRLVTLQLAGRTTVPASRLAERRRARRARLVGQRRRRPERRPPASAAGQVRAPQPVGVGLRPRRWSGRSAPSAGGPRGPSPRRRASSRLCSSSQLSLPSVVRASRRTRTNRPAQLLAVQVDVQLALRRAPSPGSSVRGRLPRAAVPDDDVAAAVLAGRDHALEVEVLDRVVLDVHAPAAGPGSSVGPFGHRPARPARRRSRAGSRSAAAAPGAAARRTAVALLPDLAGRLGRAREVPHPSVRREVAHAGPVPRLAGHPTPWHAGGLATASRTRPRPTSSSTPTTRSTGGSGSRRRSRRRGGATCRCC